MYVITSQHWELMVLLTTQHPTVYRHFPMPCLYFHPYLYMLRLADTPTVNRSYIPAKDCPQIRLSVCVHFYVLSEVNVPALKLSLLLFVAVVLHYCRLFPCSGCVRLVCVEFLIIIIHYSSTDWCQTLVFMYCSSLCIIGVQWQRL